MKKSVIKATPPSWYYLQDRDTYRIGRSDWPNDTFEILTQEEFNVLSHFADTIGKRIGFEFKEISGGD